MIPHSSKLISLEECGNKGQSLLTKNAKSMNDKDILVKIGTRIKELRIAKQMTQDTLAAKCNWDYQYVSRLESGNTNMTIRTIIKLCYALEVNLEDVFKNINI